MDIFDSFNSQVNSLLEPLTQPPVSSLLTVFLLIYGGLAAPTLPPQVKDLFNNQWFRVVILALILWVGNRDPVLAIGVAIAFLASLNLLGQNSIFELFEGPATAIYPGCMNMTVYDLLESFQNDKKALLNAMLVSRVPGDVKITDYWAPLIATYLLNRGYTLKSPCTPPSVDQKIGSWI